MGGRSQESIPLVKSDVRGLDGVVFAHQTRAYSQANGTNVLRFTMPGMVLMNVRMRDESGMKNESINYGRADHLEIIGSCVRRSITRGHGA